MKEQSTECLVESRPSREDLAAFARQRIQSFFQQLLEEEVEGRGSIRRPATATGTASRAGLPERFESRLLPLFKAPHRGRRSLAPDPLPARPRRGPQGALPRGGGFRVSYRIPLKP